MFEWEFCLVQLERLVPLLREEKTHSDRNRIFKSLARPGEFEKKLIFTNGNSVPKLDRIYFSYQHLEVIQDLFRKQTEKLGFVQGVNLTSLTLWKTTELNTYFENTHIVQFISPRDVPHVDRFKVQLGSTFSNDATSFPLGLLLVDSFPQTDYCLLYCTNSRKTSSKSYSTEHLEQLSLDMSTQNLSFLRAFKHISHKCTVRLPQISRTKFIRFQSYCMVNFLNGHLQEVKKRSAIESSKSNSRTSFGKNNLEEKMEDALIRK